LDELVDSLSNKDEGFINNIQTSIVDFLASVGATVRDGVLSFVDLIADKLTVKELDIQDSMILHSPDGKCFEVTINNDGVLDSRHIDCSSGDTFSQTTAGAIVPEPEIILEEDDSSMVDDTAIEDTTTEDVITEGDIMIGDTTINEETITESTTAVEETIAEPEETAVEEMITEPVVTEPIVIEEATVEEAITGSAATEDMAVEETITESAITEDATVEEAITESAIVEDVIDVESPVTEDITITTEFE